MLSISQSLLPKKLSFKAISEYDDRYNNSCKHNGSCEDVFVSSQLEKNFPCSDGIDVIDIGAGDGRNAIAIAEKGYNVTASELSGSGREKIKKTANSLDLDVDVIGQNILTESGSKKFDFGLMCLVTQHFSKEKLDQAFANISKIIKPEGIFVFNALVRNKGSEDLQNEYPSAYSGDYYQENCEEEGTCHFKQSDIIDTAEKSGFEVKEIVEYNEPKENRPHYMNSCRWGTMINNPAFNRPVTLKWFVLEKNK